jgi:hypothetical protein
VSALKEGTLMRRFIIAGALLANVLASGLVLLELLNGGGWGNSAQLSITTVELLVVTAAVAVTLNILLAPVLGISFWARDRGTHRLEKRLAESEYQPRQEGTPA